MFKDAFGRDINVGDIVTYPVQYGHWVGVHVAQVARFTGSGVTVEILHRAGYRPVFDERMVTIQRVENITLTGLTREEADALLAAKGGK